jgi:hypothetical protein
MSLNRRNFLVRLLAFPFGAKLFALQPSAKPPLKSAELYLAESELFWAIKEGRERSEIEECRRRYGCVWTREKFRQLT